LNLLNIKNGQANIAVIQDFLTTAFLLSSKSNFFDRKSVCSILSMATRCEEHIDLPLPAILFPVPLWTGKQIISMIFNPNRQNKPLKITLSIKEKRYQGKHKALHFDSNDGYVSFRNGILLSGQLGKSSLGGSKSGLIYRLLKEYSSFVCSKVLVRFSRLSSRLIELMGMTFGISDVTPSIEAKHFIGKLFKSKNEEASKIINDFMELEKSSKKSQRIFLEDKLKSVLNASRDEAGKFLTSSLNLTNKALIMAQSGAKGSVLNICQMVSTLGQQIVNGKRVQNGFIGRTLPHFKHEDLMPESRGFVFNSFYTGLLPTEFFFHTMAGREGLIDTAVKTADTGYMQRKLVKVMEDLVVEYDFSVRSSEGKLVQFLYGDDAFDPLVAETEEFPVDLKEYQDIFSETDLKQIESSDKFQQIQEMLNKKVLENRDIFQELKEDETLWVQNMVKTIEENLFNPLLKIYPKFCRSNLKLNTQLIKIFLILSQKKLEEREINEIFKSIQRKMMSVYVHPGEAVGALTAQSLGEPCTQMTLKTFHFAGVASMNVTLGVPRIKEIMNAAENITTPIIEVALKQKEVKLAKMVKNQINCVKLVDILKFAEEVANGQSIYLRLVLDQELMKRCFINTNAFHLRTCLLQAKLKLKPKHIDVENNFELRVQSPIIGKTESFFYLKNLLKKMQSIPVYGVPTIVRSVLNETDSGIKLYAEGTGIKEVFGIPEVDFTKTKTNHIREILTVLGVEAARSCIISQIQYTIGIYGIKVDPRHVALMADVMCFTGKLVGLNRYGIVKMKNSPLMLASFEKTGEILFDSAFFGASDGLKGVTEKILFGKPVELGTGKFEVRLDCSA
jgi:DNA-directed RNA polymerase III subunit RPC1